MTLSETRAYPRSQSTRRTRIRLTFSWYFARMYFVFLSFLLSHPYCRPGSLRRQGRDETPRGHHPAGAGERTRKTDSGEHMRSKHRPKNRPILRDGAASSRVRGIGRGVSFHSTAPSCLLAAMFSLADRKETLRVYRYIGMDELLHQGGSWAYIKYQIFDLKKSSLGWANRTHLH